MAMTGGPQPDTTVAAPKAPVRPMPSAAQATALGIGRTEGDAAEGSPDIVVVVERTGGESSLALTSVGSDSPAWGEPLLWWASLEDPTLTLFTLDYAAESMEQESLDVGIASMLEDLDHARGALRLSFPPARYSLDPASCPFLSLYTFYILTIVSLQSLIAHSQGKSRFLRQ